MTNDSSKPITSRQYHFDPETYLESIRQEVPNYDRVQDEIVKAISSLKVEQFLDLGAGTGETSLGVLKFYPNARAILLEEQESMMPLLATRMKDYDTHLVSSSFADELPAGDYSAVVSAFAVHHLKGIDKKYLFERIYDSLREGGIWAFGDVFEPAEGECQETPIDPSCDFPSSVAEVRQWLSDVGFVVEMPWQEGDLAVFRCIKPESEV